jgi:1,4-dihydroxy-2-naphthoyl-CoA hydrolase
MSRHAITASDITRMMEGTLPGHLGVEAVELGENFLKARLPLKPEHFAPNGFVHAGSIITLADTAAGIACMAHLPEGALSFTTLELKANFTGAARSGTLHCEARALHLGKTTQVWDATVHGDGGQMVASFRCTQLILYPRG